MGDNGIKSAKVGLRYIRHPFLWLLWQFELGNCVNITSDIERPGDDRALKW